MRYGRCYGLECGHHTAKEFEDIPIEQIQGVTLESEIYLKNLLKHYYRFVNAVPGFDMVHCPKCNDMKRIIRINVFVDNILESGSGIKT